MQAPLRRKTIADADGSSVTLDWMTAAAFIGFGGALYWPYREDFPLTLDAREFNPMILMPVILARVGVRFAVKGALSSLRLRKYGESWLDACRFAPGGRFDAVLRTGKELAPQALFSFNLRCLATRRHRSGEGRSKPRLHWETTARVEAHGRSSAHGIPVLIDVPLAAAPPAALPSDEYTVGTRWVLIARASGPGLDYKATFNLHAVDPDAEPDEDDE